MPLRLIIEDDEGATTIVPLATEAITIGRQQGNTIQLTEKNVSRNHARLYPEDECWVIEDLNSYNGIKVNDKSVEARTKLREGDIVQIGDYHLAITEDVDKRTLNYDRPGVAANDGEGADPLLASSSADLPRLSADEIHALSSGPQPITPAPSPMMVDSGPVPATPYAPGYAEPRKKSGGLLVLLGVLVLGAAAAGAFLITNGDKKDDATTTAAVDKKSGDGGSKAQPANPTPPTEPVPSADSAAEPVPAADAGDDAAVEPVPDEPPPEPTPEPTPEAVDPPPPEPPPEDVVIDDTPDPVPEPAVVKKKKKQPKPPPTKSNPKPPPPPVDSGPSAQELLKQAQKANLKKNYREAYNLAKESNKKSPSQGALKVMGSAACNLGDKSKAKSAHRKLRGGPKSDVEKLCKLKGIEL